MTDRPPVGGPPPGAAPPPPGAPLPPADGPPPPAPPYPPPSEPAPDDGGPGWFSRNATTIIVAVLALVVGIGIGAAATSGGDDEEATSGGGVVDIDGDEDEAESTTTTRRATTTTEATTTTAAPYTPVPTDFQINLIEVERSCFGSAGCNITYRPDPSYVGAQLPDPSKSYTIIYEVQGGEDPKTANMTLEDDQFSFREDYISTPPNPTLAAVPTQVLAD